MSGKDISNEPSSNCFLLVASNVPALDTTLKLKLLTNSFKATSTVPPVKLPSASSIPILDAPSPFEVEARLEIISASAASTSAAVKFPAESSIPIIEAPSPVESEASSARAASILAAL